MDATSSRGKQPISAAMAGPYGHPFHPILVTVPIGAWTASLVFDIASHLVSAPAFLTTGSTWLIGIGVVGAAAAALVGFLDLLAIPARTPAFRVGLTHMSLNLLVTAAYAVGFAWRQHGGLAGGPVPAAALLLSVASFAVLALSGSLGGRLAYRYGVRVADEATQAEGFTVRAHIRTPEDARRAG